MSHEEVIQILTEMHDDCSERIDCAGCKFLAMNNTCALRMIPAEWRLDLLNGEISKEVDEVENMPSVSPQQRTGHWIIIDDCEQFIAKCSECGRIEDSRMISKYPYCHCGAKMEVEE